LSFPSRSAIHIDERLPRNSQPLRLSFKWSSTRYRAGHLWRSQAGLRRSHPTSPCRLRRGRLAILSSQSLERGPIISAASCRASSRRRANHHPGRKIHIHPALTLSSLFGRATVLCSPLLCVPCYTESRTSSATRKAWLSNSVLSGESIPT
jgi:hypothetical protein